MNNRSGAFVLLGSILLSSSLTYVLTKAKYEKGFGRAQKAEPKPKETEEEIPVKRTSPIVSEKGDITKYTEKYKQINEELLKRYSPDPSEHPVREFIDQDIFEMDSDEYEKIGFTLYSDGVLVDERNNIVTDRENNVGIEAVERFNEYERDGAVYVRNYQTKSDFEILRDLRPYSEAVAGGYTHAYRS